MIKLILKKACLFGLITCSIATQAAQSKELLANRCAEIIQQLAYVSVNQNRSVCIDKLTSASTHVNSAMSLIWEESYPPARDLLNNATLALQYAELSNCKNLLQIAHLKFEVNQLKHLL